MERQVDRPRQIIHAAEAEASVYIWLDNKGLPDW